MFIFDTYDMIEPVPNSLKEYELFYTLYSQNIKTNILMNQVLKELKFQLSNLNTEIIQTLKKNELLHDVELLCLGLKQNKGNRYKYSRSLSNSDSILLNTYFSENYDAYIDFITNYQQIIVVYSSFETTVKAYLNSKYHVDSQKQKNLISDLLNTETKLLDSYNSLTNNNFSSDDLKQLWLYYTNIRNLYSHSGGIIGTEFINKMMYLKTDIEKIKEEKFIIENSFVEHSGQDLFQLNCLNEGDLFKINEYNLRFFRNLLVNIWESIYTIYNSPKKEDEIIFFKKNTFKIDVYKTEEKLLDIQTMPETLTSYSSHFHISGYLCPKCIKNGLFLYKVKFKKEPIDISDLLCGKKDKNRLAKNAFCCPCCKSFYFPKYGENLSDNNGFNVFDISDKQYIKILDMLNKEGL